MDGVNVCRGINGEGPEGAGAEIDAGSVDITRSNGSIFARRAEETKDPAVSAGQVEDGLAILDRPADFPQGRPGTSISRPARRPVMDRVLAIEHPVVRGV